MKSLLASLLLLTLSFRASAQTDQVRVSIDSINAILRANPYYDGFNQIAFYYSVDIRTGNEFIVEMNFDGPFRWVYRAMINDLDLSSDKQACNESATSLCWNCRTASDGSPGSSVTAEMIITEGGSQKENASSICVSFSNNKVICNDLKRRFTDLFAAALKTN